MLQLMDMVRHKRGGVYMYIGFNIDFGIFFFSVYQGVACSFVGMASFFMILSR